MNFLRKLLVRILCLWAVLVAMPGSARTAELVPAGLRALAATGAHPETWPRLRAYAQAQHNPEWSGWAYFLAGYHEYTAQDYAQAAEDLARAAQSGFSLADYAAYYQASALSQSSRPQDAAAALADFTSRFPTSHLRDQAFTLRASALVDAHQAQQAIDVLLPAPETRKRPALALLLGQAYVQAHQPMDAATAFYSVYYNFPLSSQAKSAADALHALREELGVTYPEPDVSLKMARAEALLKGGRYPDAQNEYSALLKAEPSSHMVPYWQLGQARCFLRQHQTADALSALSNHYAAADLEAQRLDLLVRAHMQQGDTAALAQELAQLDASFALFPQDAEALSAVGMFYYRQLNWQEAARAYRRLYQLFPQNEHLRDDGWRLAWCDYLLGDPKATEDIRAYLMQFPDSSRAPAALYWLSRCEERQGAFAEAEALYALLVKRFVHTYYAPQAAARLAALRMKQGSLAGANDLSAAPITAALIPVLPSPVIPQGIACLASDPTDVARPALILQALGLENLEEDYLRAALGESHPPVELRLMLTQIYAAHKNTAGALYSAIKIAPEYPYLEYSELPKEVWNILYPQAFRQLVQRQARLNKLDPYLVMGLIRQESGFNARALSEANARGLMQVLPETAAHSSRPSRVRLASRRLYDPAYNVRVGCAFLAGLLKDFGNHPEIALAAYNAGDFRVRDWTGKISPHDPDVFLESIPISATRIYVEAVLRDAEIFRQLSSGTPHFAQCSQAKASAPPRPPKVTRGGTELQNGVPPP